MPKWTRVIWVTIALALSASLGGAGYWALDHYSAQSQSERSKAEQDQAKERQDKRDRFNKGVDEGFKEQAELIKWIHNAASNHKRRLSSYGENAYVQLQYSQWALTVLGLIATLILGLGGHWAQKVALVPTALVTAVSALTGFYDLQGSAARHYATVAAVSQLESEIEFRMMLAKSDPESPIKPDDLKTWYARLDSAVTKHLDGFVKAVGPKN